VDFYKTDIGSLRTGRANAAIVENILVDAYGTKMPVKGLASINIPEARTIVIEPWDKGLIKEIEKAIRLRARASILQTREYFAFDFAADDRRSAQRPH